MKVEEALSQIDDMIMLQSSLKSKDIMNKYQQVAEKKTSVSSDQLDHFQDSIAQRNLRASIESLDDLSAKGGRHLVANIDQSLNIMISTVNKLRQKIQTQRKQYQEAMTHVRALESSVESEYVQLKDKYHKVLMSTLNKSFHDSEQRLALQKKKNANVIDVLRQIHAQYVEETTSATVLSAATQIDQPTQKADAVTLTDNPLRKRLLKDTDNSQPVVPTSSDHTFRKSVAQWNNEQALQQIQRRLEKTMDVQLSLAKRQYDAKLKFPIRTLEEKRRISKWRRRFQLNL